MPTRHRAFIQPNCRSSSGAETLEGPVLSLSQVVERNPLKPDVSYIESLGRRTVHSRNQSVARSNKRTGPSGDVHARNSLSSSCLTRSASSNQENRSRSSAEISSGNLPNPAADSSLRNSTATSPNQHAAFSLAWHGPIQRTSGLSWRCSRPARPSRPGRRWHQSLPASGVPANRGR